MTGKNELETSIECSIERKEKETLYGQERERKREEYYLYQGFFKVTQWVIQVR